MNRFEERLHEINVLLDHYYIENYDPKEAEKLKKERETILKQVVD